MPIIYPNKSIHLSPGMVNDLKDGSVDMIGAEFVVTFSSRSQVVMKKSSKPFFVQKEVQVIHFESDCAIFYTNLHKLFCQFIS